MPEEKDKNDKQIPTAFKFFINHSIALFIFAAVLGILGYLSFFQGK